MNPDKGVSLFLDNSLTCFDGITGFTFVFPVDGLGKDTEIFFPGRFESLHVFIDPEAGQSRIDESVMGFSDQDGDGGEEGIAFFIGPSGVDGIENIGETENGGDTERGLRDQIRFFFIERPFVVIGDEGDEGVIESVGAGYFSGEVLMRIDDFA